MELFRVCIEFETQLSSCSFKSYQAAAMESDVRAACRDEREHCVDVVRKLPPLHSQQYRIDVSSVFSHLDLPAGFLQHLLTSSSEVQTTVNTLTSCMPVQDLIARWVKNHVLQRQTVLVR